MNTPDNSRKRQNDEQLNTMFTEIKISEHDECNCELISCPICGESYTSQEIMAIEAKYMGTSF